MDGSDRKAIITDKVGWPNGITIDYPLNKLYWADGEMDKIERCNLDGTEREVCTLYKAPEREVCTANII